MVNLNFLINFFRINNKSAYSKKFKIMKGGMAQESGYIFYIWTTSLCIFSLWFYFRKNCVTGVMKRNNYDIIKVTGRNFKENPSLITIYLWKNNCWRRFQQTLPEKTFQNNSKTYELDQLTHCGLLFLGKGKAPKNLCLIINNTEKTALLTNNNTDDKVVSFELA